MSHGRIAVLMPEVYDALDKEFLTGVKTAAGEIDHDVMVFTSVVSEISDSYICGENNIYELPFFAKVDGIIMAANRFRKEKLKRQVLERLDSCSIPCVAVEERFGNIRGVFLDQGKSIYSITEHLISCHGYKKIICLTGPQGNHEAEERADGFAQAMKDNGLDPTDSVIYGDFWNNAPVRLTESIVSGELKRPQAIVCTNDIMAITLCQELQKHGINVPDDIAVTGYDGSIYTLMTRPAITTVCGGDMSLGILAVRALSEQMGIKCGTADSPVYIRTGGSCGCGSIEKEKEALLQYTEKILRTQLERKNFTFTNYIAKMSDCESIPKFSAVLDSLRYMMPECRAINICICEDWRVDSPEYRKHGFSDNMELIYSENQPGQLMFPIGKLLPQLEHPHEPQFWVFSSLHYSDRIIGYIATSYSDAERFAVDDHYISWCDAVANGLDIVIKKSNTEFIWQKLEEKNMTDMRTGLLSRRGFLSKLNNTNEILLIKFPQGYEKINYFVSIVSAILRSEWADLPKVYLGENVFGLALRGEVKESVTKEICHTLTELGIYTDESRLTVSSGEVTFQTAENKLDRMFTALTESLTKRSNEIYSDIFANLRKEMRYSPQSDWSISAAAARTGLSRSHFQRLYKKYFNISFNEELINFRLDRAKYLLTDTPMTIQQIAGQCGYTNSAHFMRQFKQRTGISPGQFRKAGSGE